MPEQKQLLKSREGDLNTVGELCKDTWETLYRYIYGKVQNREEAEDITQETYVRAISYILDRNAKIEKHINFLKRVSLNILRDRWRKSKRQGTIVNFEKINPEEAAVEDSAEASAQRELVMNAMNSLNDEQRTVIELRIIKGYSVSETARIMNKKEGAVRVLQYRSIRTLASILENNE